MIVKRKDESALSAIAEDADDLLALRRVIKRGDMITGSTTRVLKRDRDYSRPDRGERVRITVTIMAEKISLDGTIERLRIGGTVHESNNDSVPHGTHHSMTVAAGDAITISKRVQRAGGGKGGWARTEHRILKGGGGGKGGNSTFILVAMDTADCGVALLRGTHLDVSPNMYSGRGGKRYKTNHNMEDFFGQVASAIDAVAKEAARGGGGGQESRTVILFGPGNTKKRFANYIGGRQPRGGRPGYEIMMVEGIDSGGEDGIHVFAKSEAMREAISSSKLALVSGILDRIIGHAHKKVPRYAMGYEETLAAARMGAVDSLIFADGALQQYGDEQKVVDLLNMAEESGADVYGVDSSTDIGLRAAGLGGIVALLRYAVE
ncbi:MAG: mRNA surveillance protein Pelota [Thaumarchaeota archaeon]|nr:mRNA surveillance protein Pelota [Nitrososphaerota archaeon]